MTDLTDYQKVKKKYIIFYENVSDSKFVASKNQNHIGIGNIKLLKSKPELSIPNSLMDTFTVVPSHPLYLLLLLLMLCCSYMISQSVDSHLMFSCYTIYVIFRCITHNEIQSQF